MRTSSRGPFLAVLLLAVPSATTATLDVGTYEALKQALSAATPGDILQLRDGVYSIPPEDFALVVATDRLTIRSASGRADRVTIEGRGMHAASPAHAFYVKADDFTLEHVTLRAVRRHLIQVEGSAAGTPDGQGADGLQVRDCVFLDAGEQMLKASSDGGAAADRGRVERCRFAYSAGVGPRDYIGGIDVHRASDWVVQDCVFSGIRSPNASLAEHAIHFWTACTNTVVQRNRIVNCDRGIGFGLGDRGHQGGRILNNMIANDGTGRHEDVGIGLESSPGTLVAHNTILLSRYPNAIEWRFPATTGVRVVNNLANRAFAPRDGASADVRGNRSNAEPSWFSAPAVADLHLTRTATEVVDGGAPVGVVADDFDGEPRPAGSASDVGADERVAAPSAQSLGTLAAAWPFFPFCIDWHDARKRSFAEQAVMLKELGYAGVGHIWLDDVAGRLQTLDAAGLRLFQITMTVDLTPGQRPYDARFPEVLRLVNGRKVQFDLLVNGRPSSDPAFDAEAVKVLREMSDLASSTDAQLLLYPHVGSWIERIEDSCRVADQVDRPNVGVMFNLCHWLRVDPERDVDARLRLALPRLWAVSLNGADIHDEGPGWDHYIQPLDRGSYDVLGLLQRLRDLGYRGPIGLQCYGIGGDAREHLARSMDAWQKMLRQLER